MHKHLTVLVFIFCLTSIASATLNDDWKDMQTLRGGGPGIEAFFNLKMYSDNKGELENLYKIIQVIESNLNKNQVEQALKEFNENKSYIDEVVSKYLNEVIVDNQKLSSCLRDVQCAKQKGKDLTQNRFHSESKLRGIVVVLLNHLYFKIADIYFYVGDDENALKYYIKNEKLVRKSKAASVMMFDRYKYSHVLVLALKKVDFSLRKFVDTYSDDIEYSFGKQTSIKVFDDNNVKRIVFLDPDNFGHKGSGIVLIDFIDASNQRWKVFYKAMNEMNLKLDVGNIGDKQALIVNYSDDYKNSYNDKKKFPDINVNRIGKYTIKNGIEVIEDFDNGKSIGSKQKRFNDNREDEPMEIR